VDDIAPDKQWNTQAAFLHGDALQLVDGVDVRLVENGTDLAAANVVGEMIRYMSMCSLHLAHLADFLVKAHLGKELITAGFRAAWVWCVHVDHRFAVHDVFSLSSLGARLRENFSPDRRPTRNVRVCLAAEDTADWQEYNHFSAQTGWNRDKADADEVALSRLDMARSVLWSLRSSSPP
jgi:hypothetical protein